MKKKKNIVFKNYSIYEILIITHIDYIEFTSDHNMNFAKIGNFLISVLAMITNIFRYQKDDSMTTSLNFRCCLFFSIFFIFVSF